MKSKILFSLIFLFTLFSGKAQTATNIKTVEVTAFAKEIKTTQKPQILDVRTPEEFATGHIDNAQNIDWQGENFVKNVEKLNKNKPVYVYCRSGKRSLKASEKLEELGFKNIYNLDGGFLKWNAEKQKAQ
ncbi:rhodanese-like domain-containing protein [Flavobacterium sufflavum]|uniref:Rhodanese-like domain-containing protein n=1 Tax=Flavobacterium sufflavum TaxID=1921138 RepID=A0A437KYB6_9FLAO|nr:rhodanese-like domain-containing protein [Flavobacterium sufflavum]RVT77523.1 rhodanese-like domain-containing protein [Flavobacterium sufflavum]